MRTQCVYTLVFAFLCFLHQANNNSILTFIAVVVTRNFLFLSLSLFPISEIVDVERNEIVKASDRERERKEGSCGLMINLFSICA